VGKEREKVANRGSLFTVALAMVAAAALLALAGTRPAQATFPGLNGRIAFEKEGDVWEVGPPGSDQRNLMPGPNNSSGSPAWSPDGTKIAFQRTLSGGNTEIFTMNADGSGLRRLTDNAPTWDDAPAWSPDGRKIVFMRWQTDRYAWDLWTMNADGTGERRLAATEDWDFHPAWSPDGRTIAFARESTLYLMNSDGTDQRRVSATGAIGDHPNWSPDGTELVFDKYRSGASGDEIAVINADGTEERFLTDNIAVDDRSPAFSPSGRFITFHSCPRHGSTLTDCRIRRMGYDRTFPVDLTSPPAGELHLYPNWQPRPAFRLDNNAITVPFRHIVPIYGTFVYGGIFSSGQKLTLWEQPAGSFKDFAPVPGAETTTEEDGSFAFEEIQPQKNTNYQVRFAGDPEAGLEPAMSPIKPVDVRVLVSLDLSTDRLKQGNTLLISGEVEPSHTGEVTLTIKRDGKKVAQKGVQLDEGSRYAIEYEPRRVGEYSVVATYPSDEGHAGGQSPKRGFKVLR
jgi:Tol biopolymer transport system component